MTDMELAEEIRGLIFDAIKHGDEKHQAWLHDKSHELAPQIIAALRRGPEPVHHECEQCGMLVACWSDAQIEEINRLAAALHAKIKPRIDAEASKEPK